jgi:hypothetical protein
MFVAAASVAVIAAAGSPALAHDIRVVGPWGCGVLPASCGYGEVKNNHTVLYACDTKADGAGLRVKWEQNNGVFGEISDGNGSSSGCGSRTASSGTYYKKIAVCSNGVGTTNTWVCNPWTDV